MNSKNEKLSIITDNDLEWLINRFQNGPPFAVAFEFETEQLWEKFLNAIGLNLEEFNSRYFYYDKERGLHIAESEDGYVWISNMGLVAKSRTTNNRYINAFSWQKTILIHLLDAAIALSDDESTYDIDSYNYSMIGELTPGLFHNTVFYLETLAKAYLSINEEEVPKTHKLEKLLKLIKETMFKKQQNNTLFHADVIKSFESVVNHIASIPGSFKEHFIKYDDNPNDNTLVDFDPDRLMEVRDLVEITYDIIMEMYYSPEDCMYCKTDLYQRLLNKCESQEGKDCIAKVYGFLLEET